MANISTFSPDKMFESMMLQLHAQSAQQERIQHELQQVKQKLEQASLTLAKKDQLIDMLELDLEHMVDQLSKIQQRHGQPISHCSTGNC